MGYRGNPVGLLQRWTGGSMWEGRCGRMVCVLLVLFSYEKRGLVMQPGMIYQVVGTGNWDCESRNETSRIGMGMRLWVHWMRYQEWNGSDIGNGNGNERGATERGPGNEITTERWPYTCMYKQSSRQVWDGMHVSISLELLCLLTSKKERK